MAIITVDNLKSWLNITDAVDDEQLANAVAAANAAVAHYCERDFDKTEVINASARVFRPRSPYTCDVDDFWTTSGLVIAGDPSADGTYEQTWSSTYYSLEPLNGRKHGITWPYETIRAVYSFAFAQSVRPTLRVTAAWGWAAIPDPVFEATLIKAARLFRRKDSPDGVIGGFSDMGPVRVSKYEDPDVCALLDPYVRSSKRVLVA